jgi:hypothetical protein
MRLIARIKGVEILKTYAIESPQYTASLHSLVKHIHELAGIVGKTSLFPGKSRNLLRDSMHSPTVQLLVKLNRTSQLPFTHTQTVLLS